MDKKEIEKEAIQLRVQISVWGYVQRFGENWKWTALTFAKEHGFACLG